ncbi:MAG TPA: TonB-dependent receptor, partial [Blastocatellia bacterium]|nr:TonB-dependent receptor [Blastocatellia bacterium]
GAFPAPAFSQSAGTLRGTVATSDGATPLHDAVVTIVQLKRSTTTGDDGTYQFQDVPAGTYTVMAHLEGFPDAVKTVRVSAGETATADINLNLTGPREEVTVTVTGDEQSAFEAFQAVNSLDATQIAEQSHPSLGEVLEREPGVAKRSFGPGTSRPVIRGFDGDRVLVLQDGIRSGSLGSQSGDHGEPIDVLSLERLEVVRGPATLLYGSNAIGGVVNAITGHDDEAHRGVRGYVTGLGGTTNNQGGISGGFEYGFNNWMVWGSGSGQRTGDYDTPIGEIPNSQTRVGNGLFGFGYFGDKAFFNLSASYDDRRYGVPFAAEFEGGEEGENIELSMHRANFRFKGGVRNTGAFLDAFRLTLDYTKYDHRELEGNEVGTIFDNKLFSYRGVFDQRRTGRLSGRFGFEGNWRDYVTVGAEALAPPVDQSAFAVFTLQELDYDRMKFQFGGRVERNAYDPTGARERDFTGFSGALGARFALWEGAAFVANYTHSYRAPALEELYNFGPHIGNLTFEVGNQNLERERGDGIDLSLRHAVENARAEINFFYYNLKDFIFLAPTGEVEDGLPVANYTQGDSRFIGMEAGFDLALHRNLWLNVGVDYVDAELKDGDTPLPRIPPLRGHIGFDFAYKGLSIKPEAVMASEQNQLFPGETRTAGYTVFNVLGSYTIPRQHVAHIFTVNAFNLGDRLYRNHLSFIKDLAPEIGRGVRLSYTLRFF